MAQMTLPAEPAYKRTAYKNLLGADFSADPSLVDSRHSPDLLNMISDNGGNPIKRKGWEVVVDNEGGVVSNIWSFAEEDHRYIVYTLDVTNEGTTTSTLKVINEDGTQVLSQAMNSNGKHVGFYTNISTNQFGFYVMDLTVLHRLYTNSGTLTHEAVTPYVPTIIISREPTGGGGVQYEDVNLLTGRRIEMFRNETNNKNFVLSSAPSWAQDIKPTAKYRSSDGKWYAASIDESYHSGATVVLNASYYPPPVPGEDNIQIEYTPAGYTEKRSRVFRCTVMARYSATAQDQIFVAGHPGRENDVYYCAPNDISYWPDLNYMEIGGETRVMGFANLGEYLAVVKESSSYDSTLFLVYNTSISSKTVSASDGTTTTTQERTFAVKRASTGIGAICNNAFGVLNDEPMFLARTGVHGIISTNLTSEKVVRNRSAYLDHRLLEEDLPSAVACVWNNYYMLFVGGHVYILDGRHRSNDAAGNTNYKYEAYYWDDVPAKVVTTYEDEIWFGTADGRICRFKNSDTPADYSDGTVMGDATVTGVPIVARWATPNDNDGYSEYYKKMMKKGTMCTIAPFDKSSVNVYIRKDSGPNIYIGSWFVNIGNMFTEVPFDDLSFDTREGPRDIMFRKKQKKYQRLQIILENNKLNEPFGIYEIVKTYIFQRYAKGRSPYNALADGTLDNPTWEKEGE